LSNKRRNATRGPGGGKERGSRLFRRGIGEGEEERFFFSNLSKRKGRKKRKQHLRVNAKASPREKGGAAGRPRTKRMGDQYRPRVAFCSEKGKREGRRGE